MENNPRRDLKSLFLSSTLVDNRREGLKILTHIVWGDTRPESITRWSNSGEDGC